MTISDLASPVVMLATLLIFGCIARAADNSTVSFTAVQRAKIIDPIILAQQHFEQIQSYQVWVRSSSRYLWWVLFTAMIFGWTIIMVSLSK